jgi:hypothetical protein
MSTLKVIWLGVLLAVGSIIAFLVWAKLRMRFAAKSNDEKLIGRQPGFVGNIFSQVSGFFGGTNKPVANPPIVGGFGQVGVAMYGDEEYRAVGKETLVPSFLEGATGGVQDDEQPGVAPPDRLGPPPLSGTGAYSPVWRFKCPPVLGTVAAYDAKNSTPV